MSGAAGQRLQRQSVFAQPLKQCGGDLFGQVDGGHFHQSDGLDLIAFRLQLCQQLFHRTKNGIDGRLVG